jgi:hypothetical protein
MRALNLAIGRSEKHLISAAAVVTIGFEETGTVFLNGHPTLRLATAARCHLFIHPGTGIDIYVAVYVELCLSVHSYLASKNMLCVDNLLFLFHFWIELREEVV